MIDQDYEVIIEKEGDLDLETEKRVKKMQEELSKPLKIKLFPNIENYNQIIVQKEIKFSALCEHHHVAFSGEAVIGYIPDKYLTGLSKLPRIVEHYLNPTIKTIQERATHQILNCLVNSLQPKGAIIVLKAMHNCLAFRGVKNPSITITSAIYGAFEENQSTRSEFFDLLSKI